MTPSTASYLPLIDTVLEHARRQPRAVAVQQVDADGGVGEPLTYGQLGQKVAALAARLKQQTPPGSVIILCSPNRPDYFVAFLAIIMAERTVFPMAPDAAERELLAAIDQSKATAIIASPATAARLPEASRTIATPELAPELCCRASDAAHDLIDLGAGLLLQSSGTTGHPRIARKSWAALNAVSAVTCQALGLSPEDRVLTGLPLCHAYGMEHGLLAPVYGGSTVRLCQGIKLEVVARELNATGITFLPGVPFLFEILAQTAQSIGNIDKLRHTNSAGAMLPIALYQAFQQRYGQPIGQIYGATEIGLATFGDPRAAGFDPQSVGMPVRGVQIRILDIDSPQIDQPLPIGAIGQVAIKTSSMASHYLGGDATPFPDGFILLGDLGKLRADGCLTITGRLRLLIDIGGQKVNPVEVEQVLLRHPAINGCVVIPIPVSPTVSRVQAVLTCRQGQPTPSVEELRELVRSQLSAYKVPRVFEFRASLPRSPLGKILRHLVKPA